ncbi:MAG: deoxynucleoside kinase [Nitrospirae bacterium]|nr:deoxynucleoside kinase [Nitrospirota bacterium]
MPVKSPKYLVIEGPIGVGKTSLAKLLARELDARIVLERAEDNPFLKDFYKDPKRFAFQTQIFFLLSRYRQLQELSQMDLFERTTVTDYFFPKDRIFASINLDESEMALYRQLYSLLNPAIPTPDLVVYLQAGPEVLMDRVRHRGLEYEKPLSPDYLDALNQSYNDFFFQYTDSPLLVVQTSEIDFVNRRADLDDLLHQIVQMKKGTQYYVPRK